jgi:DNA-binding response OmpR family regulator
MAFLLVVDDDARVCDLLRRLLVRAGHSVACATGGEEALAALRDRSPDLVILDWMMPGLDGMGVLKRLRADPATAGTAVMVYTASDDPQVARDATRLGALDCVQKVGRFNDLRERISACLVAACRPRPSAVRFAGGGDRGGSV